MPVIDLEQNTPEWLEFRKGKIGASDCPIIMGVSPYCTPHMLWMRKLGLAQEQEENEAMREGKRLEPIALELFNESYGSKMKPTVYQHDFTPWMFASLDGYDGVNVLEIKCSKKLYDLALNSFIPVMYLMQMYHQMIVTNTTEGFYYAFYERRGLRINVTLSEGYKNEILKKEEEFNKCRINFIPPPMSEKDFAHSHDDVMKCKIDKWKVMNGCRKQLDEEEELLRKDIIDMCQGRSTICNGVKMQKVPRKGNVDYSAIPALKDIDLDAFRKPSSETWRFTCE